MCGGHSSSGPPLSACGCCAIGWTRSVIGLYQLDAPLKQHIVRRVQLAQAFDQPAECRSLSDRLVPSFRCGHERCAQPGERCPGANRLINVSGIHHRHGRTRAERVKAAARPAGAVVGETRPRAGSMNRRIKADAKIDPFCRWVPVRPNRWREDRFGAVVMGASRGWQRADRIAVPGSPR
jgi:hypothetical protein